MFDKALAAGAALSLLAGPALADLTAEEVLADQLNLLSGYGAIEVETTGTRTEAWGIAVDGFRGAVEDGGSTVEFLIGGIELREAGDGTVRVVYPERLPLTVRSDDPTAELSEMRVTLELRDMRHVVSGDRDDIRHAVSFAEASFADMETWPAGVVPEALESEFTLRGVDSVIRFVAGDLPRRDISLDIAGMTMRTLLPPDSTAPDGAAFGDLSEFDGALVLEGLRARMGYTGSPVPRHTLELDLDLLDWRQSMAGEGLDAMDFTLGTEDFELAYDVVLSLDALEADPLVAMRDGQRAEGRIRYAEMGYAVIADMPGGRLDVASSAGESRGDFRIGREGFSLSAESRDNIVHMQLPPDPEIPFGALSYRIAESFADIELPFMAGETRQPFKVRFGIAGIELAEEIWTLFDPEGRLPRGAAEFVLDLDGTTIVAEDPFAEPVPDFPFRGTEARLNALSLSLAGARLTGTGAGRDTGTPEAPAGEGRLDLRLTGFNRLLETLIDMGLLTDEDAMPLRMGLGMIARAGAGEDTLVSTIELREDGSIQANGQRLR